MIHDVFTSERKKFLDYIIKNMQEFEFVGFMANDIARGDLVKSYIIELDRLGL